MSGSGQRAAIESLPKRKPGRPNIIPTFRVNQPAIHRVFGAAVELPRKDTDEDPAMIAGTNQLKLGYQIRYDIV